MNLRKLARGQPCFVRLPGCDGGGATTVLAHYRLAGTSGMALKPDDLQAAFACHHCHDVCDGRKYMQGYTKTEIRLAFAEGVLRTQEFVRNLTKRAA